MYHGIPTAGRNTNSEIELHKRKIIQTGYKVIMKLALYKKLDVG